MVQQSSIPAQIDNFYQENLADEAYFRGVGSIGGVPTTFIVALTDFASIDALGRRGTIAFNGQIRNPVELQNFTGDITLNDTGFVRLLDGNPGTIVRLDFNNTLIAFTINPFDPPAPTYTFQYEQTNLEFINGYLSLPQNFDPLQYATTQPELSSRNDLDLNDYIDFFLFGNVSFQGSPGNDIYRLVTTDDRINEGVNQGIDTVVSTFNYTLGANLENLTLNGTTNINGNGNALNNRIRGNGGRNVLNGLGGNDTLISNNGNDVLNGGTGVDRMGGGAGNDNYTVDNIGDRVLEVLNNGTDLVRSTVNFTLPNHVENLNLIGNGNRNGIGNNLANRINGNSGNNNLVGNAGNDTLIGNNGNDLLNGGLGLDRMVGGNGNDSYYVDNLGDRIIELANQGNDLVRSSLNYFLGSNLENLTLIGTANRNGVGNNLANRLIGNSGNNSLRGNGGNDTLIGNNGNDLLVGNVGNDNLIGGIGRDTLIGGVGDDTLTGGGGADFYRFNSVTEGVDRITDFSVAADTFLLRRAGFAGGLSLGVLNSNQLRIGASATTPNHRLIYNENNGNLFFDRDGSGPIARVQIANLNNGLALTNQDFRVVI